MIIVSIVGIMPGMQPSFCIFVSPVNNGQKKFESQTMCKRLYLHMGKNTFLSSLVAQTVTTVYNVGDLGSIPGSGKFPGEGNGNPLQYSCLENPMDGGAWCP